MIVGLDVGGTKILGVVLGGNQKVLALQRRATPAQGEVGDRIISTMKELIESLTTEVGGSIAPLRVGVGMPGLVDRRGRLHFAPNLGKLRDFDLCDRLTKATGAEIVRVDNDATCAMRAEHRLGAAIGASNALLVTLGTGIGGGLVIEGKVVRGERGFAGEIGHMVVEATGIECVCGQRGCWEQYASGNALGRMAREIAEQGKSKSFIELAGGSISDVRGEHVTAAAARGDLDALELVSRFADWFAIGLANLVDILDVQRCVLGGGLIAAGATLLDPIRRSFATRVLGASHRPEVEIVPAQLGEQAGAIGAALLALEP